mgnify:CR=1 FL=1
MKTEHLHSLRIIAQCGSLNKAAKALYTSQPALSAIVSSLEKELGAPLIERSKSGITLTEFGKQVVEDSEEVLNYISHWNDIASLESEQGPSGTVRIGTFNMAGDVICPSVVAKAFDRYPNISIECCSIPHYNLMEYLNTDTLDIGVLGLSPINQSFIEQITKDKHWQFDIIYKEDYKAFVSSDHPLAQEKEITIEDILNSGLPFVYNLTNSFSNEFPYLDDIIPTHSSKNFKLNSYTAAMKLVALNKAIALYPDIARENNYYITTGKIASLTISDTQFICMHCLISKRNKYCSSIERIVKKLIMEAYSEFKN